jgi:hypothetical protein
MYLRQGFVTGDKTISLIDEILNRIEEEDKLEQRLVRGIMSVLQPLKEQVEQLQIQVHRLSMANEPVASVPDEDESQKGFVGTKRDHVAALEAAMREQDGLL